MSSAINWTKILARVTPRLQARVNLIRMQNDDLKRQVTELEANKPDIKWDYFKSSIEDSSFVQSLENEAKGFKPLKYTFGQVEGTISNDEKTLVSKIFEF